MEIIIKPDQKIFAKIGMQDLTEGQYVPSEYTVDVDVGDKKLIYNTLTCEMICVGAGEYTSENEYLVRHWFFAPCDLDQWSMVYMLKKMYMQTVRRRKIDKIFTYTVMTTMDCNARCYYCYEAGRKRSVMTQETAQAVADFIIRTNIGQVNLQWFGGEPLCNSRAIDIICDRLDEAGIVYGSFIVTNAYLISQHNVTDLVRSWHLERAQVTLDGTKELYNSAKAYVNQDPDAFDKVLDNIGELAKYGVSVKIRLNLSADNVADIHNLIDILYERYHEYPNVRAYSHELFDQPTKLDETVHIDVQKHLMEKGLLQISGIEQIMNNYCIADNARSVVVTPEGKLTLCEHYSESEFVGDIYHDEFDTNMLRKWQEPFVIPDCKTCPYYLRCRLIKHCPTTSCTEGTRMYTDFWTKTAMKSSYNKWKEKKV